MKLKGSSYFYLFVFLFLSGVYYFEFYKAEKDQALKDQKALLVKMSKEDIKSLTLDRGGQSLQLERSEKGWNLLTPVNDMADAEEVAGWLDSLVTEKSTATLGEGETFDWKTYGLDAPVSQLTIRSAAGAELKLALSKLKSIDGNPFVKRNEDKVVLVGSTTLAGLLEKNAIDLREKKVVREELVGIEGFSLTKAKGTQAKETIGKEAHNKEAHSSEANSSAANSSAANGAESIDVSLEGGRWILKAKPQWLLDQNKVRELVSVVRNLKAQDFALEKEPSPTEALSFGLKAPVMTATYRLAGGKEWQGIFGEDKNKTWHFTSKTLGRVAKIAANEIELLTKASLDGLRDRETPFVFPVEEVKKLSVHGANSLSLAKEGESWKAGSAEKINDQGVDDLLKRLRDLRVAEFLEGSTKEAGLEAARKEFVLMDSSGKNIFELKLGSTFNKKTEQGEEKFVYAKSSLFPEVVALKEEDLKDLKVESLIQTSKDGAAPSMASPAVKGSSQAVPSEKVPANSNPPETAESMSPESDPQTSQKKKE